MPINTGNGQTIYQTVNVPIQCFGNQFPQIVQPQMQIIPQMTQQVANIITPTGQIQQVLASVPFLQQHQPQQQQQQHVLKSDGSMTQEQTAASSAVPITVTNAQGQQIVVMRPPNQNVIQFNPNMSVPTQIQHIPGIGNVQVISASALNATPFLSQP